jgi:2-keto-4-pentenoate hydratase/2-oxohepta-3-ene-1,7-dioic acid hydratase in catechol pathway
MARISQSAGEPHMHGSSASRWSEPVAFWLVRIARFAVADQLAYGVVEGNDESNLTITVIDGHPFAPFERTSVTFPLADVRLVPPVLPSKVIGIGKNYVEHAREMGAEAPETPMMFLKPSTSVIGPGESVVLPEQSAQVEFEGEIAVVIGRLARHVPVDRVPDVVLGYTCADDVTARDLQRSDGQWTRAKGFDGFCPLGPWIATDVDAGLLAVTTRVNGEVRQQAAASAMVHSIADLVVHASSVMTLLPGDVILTGTPAGVGPLTAGDEVEVTVAGVGTLRHRVVSDD